MEVSWSAVNVQRLSKFHVVKLMVLVSLKFDSHKRLVSLKDILKILQQKTVELSEKSSLQYSDLKVLQREETHWLHISSRVVVWGVDEIEHKLFTFKQAETQVAAICFS